MKTGESIEIASGFVGDVKWRAEVHQYKNVPHARVMFNAPNVTGDRWCDLSFIGDDLEADEVAETCDDIACALAAELAKAKGIEVKS